MPVALRPEFVLSYVLLDIALILVAARLCGAVAQKVGQPRVVGEIVAGVLLGPTLLGPAIFVWDGSPSFMHCEDALSLAQAKESITSCVFPPQARSVLGILGQVALAFFMFLVGLELDWDLLKGKTKGIILVAVGVVALPVALGFAVGPLLYDAKFVASFGTDRQPSETAFSLMVGAMLSVTAFPVLARILQEKGLTQSAMGSIGIAAAAVVTVLMFFLVMVAGGVAEDRSTGEHLKKLAFAAAFLAIMAVAARPALRLLGRYFERNGFNGEVLAVVILLLFAAAFVANALEINVIVGSFVFGAILPARKALFEALSSRLADLTGTVLLPIFLAFSGLATDFTRLRAEHAAGIALFLVAGIVAKWGGGAVAARAGGLSWAEGNVIGILMNCRGLLVLVVGLLALNRGVISPQLQVGGVLMALITTAMTGPLFDRFLPSATASAPPVQPVASLAEPEGESGAAPP